MSGLELYILYIVGAAFSLIMYLVGQEGVFNKERPVLAMVISVFCWPIFLPLSFLALWANISYHNWKLVRWVIKKLKLEITYGN